MTRLFVTFTSFALSWSLYVHDLVAQDLVISNARIIVGDGRVIDRGSVVARAGRIVSVSEGAVATQRVQAIDAKGMTLMPGFIDAHRHIMQGDAAQWLKQQAAARMQEFLDAGFTTIVGAGERPEILELRRMIEQDTIKGPRVVAAGRIPLARGEGRDFSSGDTARFVQARPEVRPKEPAKAIPAEETRAAVAATAKAGYDMIKTSILVTPGGPEKDTLRLIVEEGKKYGLPVLTHAVSVVDALAAVEAGVAALAHTPHVGHLTEEDVRKIAGAGIPMTSTLGIFIPKFSSDNKPLFRDRGPFPFERLSNGGQGPVNARLLWEGGLTYGYGTDTGWLPKDSLDLELRPLALVFSPKDIVTILTRNAAILIGRGDQLGTLEPGKLADIVMLDGNPLEGHWNLLNAKMVIKGGTVVVDKR